MAKKSVTSHNQKGGVTAFDVKSGTAASGDSPKEPTGLPKWAQWAIGGATILGVIVGALTLIYGG